MVASADIYFHNPPVSIDDVTTSGVPVAIMVEGDIISKKYDFIKIGSSLLMLCTAIPHDTIIKI